MDSTPSNTNATTPSSNIATTSSNNTAKAPGTTPSPLIKIPAGKALNLGARRASSPILRPEFVEQGLKKFHEERQRDNELNGASTSQSQLPDGGQPSSAAFTQERAADDARFRTETTGPTGKVTSEVRRDARIADASPSAPPSFTVGPTSAARPITRTSTAVTIGSEADLAASTAAPVNLESGATPIVNPDVFSILNMLPLPPPPKKGKGKDDPTSHNFGILCGHIVALQKWVSEISTAQTNSVRVLERKILRVSSAGSAETSSTAGNTADDLAPSRLDVTEYKIQLDRLQRDVTRLSGLVALEGPSKEVTTQLEGVNAELDNFGDQVKREFDQVYGDIQALQEAQRLRGSRDDDFETLRGRFESSLDANEELRKECRTLTTKVTILEGKVASAEQKVRGQELQLLETRGNVAELQKESALQALAVDSTEAAPGNTAQANTGGSAGRSFELGRKRGAPADAETSAAKRTRIPAEVGSRNDYPHWLLVSPAPPNTVNGSPATIFKRMIAAAFRDSYMLPTVYIERKGVDFLIGFTKKDDADTLEGRWKNEPNRPFEKTTITTTTAPYAKASGSGLSGRETARQKEIALLSGN
ncbi:hypothetical protein C8R43DRAFT_327891 [Mycena crocata]|nr:hypothetical protein C8R43DRAFT_327891 [Mycena crocata]